MVPVEVRKTGELATKPQANTEAVSSGRVLDIFTGSRTGVEVRRIPGGGGSRGWI